MRVTAARIVAPTRVRLDRQSTASLRQSIARLRRAIKMGNPKITAGAALYMLARAQRILFERSGEVDALAAAEEAARRAIQLTSRDDADRPSVLSNLAIVLEAHFQWYGDQASLARGRDFGARRAGGDLGR